MFFCEICEIFKNTYFEEHLRTNVSGHLMSQQLANYSFVFIYNFEAVFAYFFDYKSLCNVKVGNNDS